MQSIVRFCFCFLCTLFLLSCKKVVEIDLNTSEPRLVIEARLSDTICPNPFEARSYVWLSRSANMGEPRDSMRFYGRAFVTIQDLHTGIVDTLRTGFINDYNSPGLKGISGHEYLLTVVAEGKTYTALSKMPYKVYCDSLTNRKVSLLGEDFHNFPPRFVDKAGMKNYYKLDGYAFDDSYGDGQPNYQLFGFVYQYPPGSRVSIAFYNIDENTHNMYSTMNRSRDITNNNSPSNLPSNIRGGALGYFSAQTYQSVSSVLE